MNEDSGKYHVWTFWELNLHENPCIMWSNDKHAIRTLMVIWSSTPRVKYEHLNKKVKEVVHFFHAVLSATRIETFFSSVCCLSPRLPSIVNRNFHCLVSLFHWFLEIASGHSHLRLGSCGLGGVYFVWKIDWMSECAFFVFLGVTKWTFVFKFYR